MIVQIHPNDSLARRAVFDILNRHSDKRIRQAVLDFWRRDYTDFIKHKRGGDTIFLVDFRQRGIVGISCAAILRNSRRCFNSLTVVSRNHRNNGIGTNLLKSKIRLIETRYSDSFLVTYTSKANKHSIKMCESAGLHIIDEGRREREDKEPTEFYVLCNRPTYKARK